MVRSEARRREAAAPRDLWMHIPLELLFAASFVLLAAGLKLAGVFP